MAPPAYITVLVLGAGLALIYYLFSERTSNTNRPHVTEPSRNQGAPGTNVGGNNYRDRSNNQSRRRRSNWDKNEECVICCDTIERVTATTLSCTHAFHKDCIQMWFDTSSQMHKSCPICRAHVATI